MKPTLKPLDKQAVVITGATSGIGLATARRAARAGACVFLVARGEQDLRKLCEELQAEGARVAGLPPCPRGAVVRLDLMPGVEPARAEVRWMAGALAGLRFARPLSPAQVARLRGVTSPPGARRTARPIRTAQEMR